MGQSRRFLVFEGRSTLPSGNRRNSAWSVKLTPSCLLTSMFPKCSSQLFLSKTNRYYNSEVAYLKSLLTLSGSKFQRRQSAKKHATHAYPRFTIQSYFHSAMVRCDQRACNPVGFPGRRKPPSSVGDVGVVGNDGRRPSTPGQRNAGKLPLSASAFTVESTSAIIHGSCLFSP